MVPPSVSRTCSIYHLYLCLVVSVVCHDELSLGILARPLKQIVDWSYGKHVAVKDNDLLVCRQTPSMEVIERWDRGIERYNSDDRDA